MSSDTRSRLALWLSGIYLLPALGSWLLPLLASPGDNLTGVFLMLFAQPWTTVVIWLTDQFQIDSRALGMALLLLGVLLNTWIIYKVVSWFSNRKP